MFDVFTASITVCKRTRDCGRVKYRFKCDHDTIKLNFYLNKIDFNNKIANKISDLKKISTEYDENQTTTILYVMMVRTLRVKDLCAYHQQQLKLHPQQQSMTIVDGLNLKAKKLKEEL